MVEGARLESVCTGNCTEGSNPSLSAMLQNFNRTNPIVKFASGSDPRDENPNGGFDGARHERRWDMRSMGPKDLGNA